MERGYGRGRGNIVGNRKDRGRKRVGRSRKRERNE